MIDVDLNENSTTLIVGSNWTGKSTILDALTFVLYGRPFRKISKSQLVNATNEKAVSYTHLTLPTNREV